ncbi:MAG TPA: acyltransferase [Ktedonobacterales bacterium]
MTGEQVAERVTGALANGRPAGSPRAPWLRILLPLDSGPAEIRALDGLRAIAALMIVLFHILLFTHVEYQPWSQAAGNFWYALSSGVQLFFTLSGFLLFRPYVAAILAGKPLPPALRFYQKRALRILPAYWVALTVLLAFNWRIANDPQWLNALTHAFLIHDIFPRYNRDLDGPFWTLAVEAQFYVALPWLAAATAWLAARIQRGGGAPTPRRVVAALLGLVVGALAIRWAGFAIMGALPGGGAPMNGATTALMWLGLLLLGMQGKYLEVFLLGAIAATLYTAASNYGRVPAARLRTIAMGLAPLGLAILVPCAIYWEAGGVLFTPGAQWGWGILLYPLATGAGYSAILLAIVWGGPWLRAPFEWRPLRFIGHISYSIYIWHLPILHADLAFLQPVPFQARILLVFVVSYLSYQFVERPFLQQRRRIAATSPDS